MKKLTALIMVLITVMSLSACSSGKLSTGGEGADGENVAAESTQSKGGVTDNVKEAFSGQTLKNAADDTNIYVFNADGTYKETYKGSELEGTWEELEDDRMCLTFSETTKYYYTIDRDENNMITGLSQIEGRTFVFA